MSSSACKLTGKRSVCRKTGGHVEMQPEVKRQGHLSNRERVSGHLQRGPGGGLVLHKQIS